MLKSLVLGNVDLLIISETKIDESFPLNQFIIEGFCSPFREDRNSQGGGLIIYVREDIPCKRSKLKNIFNKDPTDDNKKLYNHQRIYCVSFLRKEKKKYYNNLDIKIFDDNRKFWTLTNRRLLQEI